MSSDVMPRHAAFGVVDGIHPIVAGYIADASAQDAGTVTDPPSTSRTVDAQDVGKVFQRSDNGTLWALRDESPVTWASLDGGWNRRAWNATIAYNLPGVTVTPEHTVTGALAITRSTTGAIQGAATYSRIVADGVNVPTFADMTEHGSSSGYSNIDGALNLLHTQFDGTMYWYAWSQEAPAPIVYTRLLTLNGGNIAESGTANAGYRYDWVSGGNSVCYAGGADQSLPASTDGYIEWEWAAIGDSDAYPVLMLNTSGGANAFGSCLIALYLLGTAFRCVESGTPDITPDVDDTLTGANGNRGRLVRIGSAWTGYVSQNSGATWTLVHTFAPTSSAQVWPGLNFNDASAITKIRVVIGAP